MTENLILKDKDNNTEMLEQYMTQVKKSTNRSRMQSTDFKTRLNETA